jgi:hypothetical protein
VALVGSAGVATATSPAYTPLATGTYCFLGVYSGDSNYQGASDGSTIRECFVVTVAPPVVVTAPGSGSQVLGGSNTDTATVTGVAGVTPTGTVTFYVCGPFATATACTTSGTDLGPVALVGSAGVATATSAAFMPLAGGTYCFLGVYSGDGNYSAASDGSTIRECFTVTVPPVVVITAPGSPSIVLGTTNSDTATVTGLPGFTPTGTVTFYVCGPYTTATACTTSGTDLGPVTLTGSGGTATATSPAYTPLATGFYCFLGVYSGDGIYLGGSDGSTTRECFSVTVAPPGVTTTPAQASIVLGTANSDTATVTGVGAVTPTGTVTFYVCGPFATVTACTTSGTDLGPVAVTGSAGTATATSPAYTPLATGTYCFVGVYSGDTNYAGGSDGSTTRECFTVTPADPTMATVPGHVSIVFGTSDTDTATATGVAGVTPTGNVHFYVCGPFATDTTCTTSGIDLGSVAVSGSGNTATAMSPAYTPPATGIYCFLGVYSGDTNYLGGSDGSTRECFMVAVAPPGVSTTPSNGSIVFGTSDTDTATVTGVGGVTPTGTVTFYVCKGASTCTTSGTNLGTVTLAGSAGVATATSPAYTPTTTGTYCFLGVYSGDGNYAGGSDGSSRECFVVTMATPSVVTTPTAGSIKLGHTNTDTVIVTGNPGGSPTGTVTFYVCGPTKTAVPCTSTKKKLNKVTLTAGANDTASATSAAFKPKAIGVWCFGAYYSGDANYHAGMDTAIEECFAVVPPCGLDVSVSPNPLVETGQSEVHAIVVVQACAVYAGDTVNIDSSQLQAACSTLTFANLQNGGTPASPHVTKNNIQAVLDDDGNADVVMNGTNCAPGQSVVETDLTVAPFLTALTTLQATAPVTTPQGVSGTPNPEVETGDTAASGNSDVYAVFYVEADPTYAEQTVEIDSPQLLSRCAAGGLWISNGGSFPGATATATLDNDGNAVFVFIGGSCASGSSTVIADVLAGSHVTYTTSYTILPPTPNS